MFDKYTLDNGVTVLMQKMPGTRFTVVNATVKNGSVLETRENNGSCHMLEHLCAGRDSLNFSNDQLNEDLDRVGSRMNASTWHDDTNYHITSLAQHDELSLRVLSERLLHPAFTQADLEEEKGIVKCEIADFEDDPDIYSSIMMMRTAFEDQPYGLLTSGTRESVDGMTLEGLRKFHADSYVGRRIIVSITGNIRDPEALLQAVDRHFGGAPQGEGVAMPATEWQGGESLIERDMDNVNFNVAFAGPSFTSTIREQCRFALLEHILGSGLSCRFFHNIRKPFGAYQAGCWEYRHHSTGVINFYVLFSRRQNHAAAVAEAVAGELERAKHDITETEVRNTAARLLSAFFDAAEHREFLAESNARRFIAGQENFNLDEIEKALADITAAEVMEMAEMVFASSPCISTVGCLDGIPTSYEFKQLMRRKG